MSLFYETNITNDNLWRALILLGKNNKTYKFALAKSLIYFANQNQSHIHLHDLSKIFADYMIEHVKMGNTQGVSDEKKGDFLIACENYRDGIINESQLYEITSQYAFRDVIDRFHTLNQSESPILFYDWKAFKSEKKLILSDEIFQLINSPYAHQFMHEIEARWRLVENAWELKIPTNLLKAQYDDISKEIYIIPHQSTRRIPVTPARSALSGYQKGCCFYCFDVISIQENDPNLCHVDHFFPHILFDINKTSNYDYNGIWNLVLACPSCNLKKQAKIPIIDYLDRLYKRNEFYVNSHLPLKETILKTGENPEERKLFLNKVYDESKQLLISHFSTENKQPPKF